MLIDYRILWKENTVEMAGGEMNGELSLLSKFHNLMSFELQDDWFTSYGWKERLGVEEAEWGRIGLGETCSENPERAVSDSTHQPEKNGKLFLSPPCQTSHASRSKKTNG